MRKGSKVTPAFLVLLVFVMGSCGGNEPCLTCPITSDTTSPTITLVSPEDGTVDVPVTSVVVIVTFSEPVDPTTVNASTFVLTKMASTAITVAGGIAVNGAVATLTLETSLEYSALYAVVVTSGVKDIAGNALGSDYEWEFTTMQDPTLWTLPEGYSMSDVAANESGVYVIGSIAYTHDLFVAKFRLDGESGWFTETDTPEAEGNCGLALSGNSLYVGRMFDTYLVAGRQEVYVDKRDAETGELIWSTLVDSGAPCHDIEADESDVYIITNFGTTLVRLSILDGIIQDSLQVRDFGWNSLLTRFWAVAVDDEVVYMGGVTGQDLTTLSAYGDSRRDFFAVAYDRDFAVRLWVSQVGDSVRKSPILKIAVAPASNRLYLTGDVGNPLTRTDLAGVVLAFELEDGSLQWLRKDTENGAVGSQVVTDGIDVYISLPVSSSLPPAQAPFRLRPDGSVVWVGSPPSRIGGIALSDGTVFGTDGTSKLIRYDAETGIMKK